MVAAFVLDRPRLSSQFLGRTSRRPLTHLCEILADARTQIARLGKTHQESGMWDRGQKGAGYGWDRTIGL